MRKNWLLTGLVLLLGVVLVARVGVQLGWPRFSFAQTSSGADNSVVGPHAAFFDVGNNIKIVNMVKSKTSKNLNMTVMVDINATAADVSSILGATGGLTPMIRIVGVDHKTTGAQAAQIAGVLNGAGLPGSTIVVFGNEVNNLDKVAIVSRFNLPGANERCWKGVWRSVQKFQWRGSWVSSGPIPC